jgi:PEP-CTERM motif-containing protein
MEMRKALGRVIVIGALALGAQTSHAALICSGCEYQDSPGTYLGSYNPLQFDFGTFQHSDVAIDVGTSTGFVDFWVFDLDPAGTGSISADFTTFTGISGFAGDLYADGGSTCAGSECSNVVLGAPLASASSVNMRWEIIMNGLPAGRYIIRVTGTTNARGTSAYTGQLAFVPEPGTLSLLGMGLFVMGLARRRLT